MFLTTLPYLTLAINIAASNRVEADFVQTNESPHRQTQLMPYQSLMCGRIKTDMWRSWMYKLSV